MSQNGDDTQQQEQVEATPEQQQPDEQRQKTASLQLEEQPNQEFDDNQADE